MKIRNWMRRLAASAAVLGCVGAAAQGFPSKPIRVVVCVAPGGSGDAIGRIVGAGLGNMGQPVVVENRPGAGTLVGTGIEAAAAQDSGQVILAEEDGEVTSSSANFGKIGLRFFAAKAQRRATTSVLASASGQSANSSAIIGADLTQFCGLERGRSAASTWVAAAMHSMASCAS